MGKSKNPPIYLSYPHSGLQAFPPPQYLKPSASWLLGFLSSHTREFGATFCQVCWNSEKHIAFYPEILYWWGDNYIDQEVSKESNGQRTQPVSSPQNRKGGAHPISKGKGHGSSICYQVLHRSKEEKGIWGLGQSPLVRNGQDITWYLWGLETFKHKEVCGLQTKQ